MARTERNFIGLLEHSLDRENFTGLSRILLAYQSRSQTERNFTSLAGRDRSVTLHSSQR
jgi:hypothetical protein